MTPSAMTTPAVLLEDRPAPSPGTPVDAETLQRALSEPFAFALLQWPLVLAVLAIDGGDDGWWIALRIACAVLLAPALLAAYSRGFGFGNTMLAAAGCIAGAWSAWPSGWAVVWLVLLALLMLAAQNLRLRRLMRDIDRPSPADRLACFDPALHGGELMAAPMTGRERI
jgi:hypothetical protein